MRKGSTLPAEDPAAQTHGIGIDLDRALARLADDERLCVVLAYSEGMSHIMAASAAVLVFWMALSTGLQP